MQPLTYYIRTCYSQLCPCTVCKIAAENLTGGSSPSMLREEYWRVLFPGVPYPVQARSKLKSVEKRCAFCSALIGKGRSHKCTKTAKQDNLHNLVGRSSPKTRQKVGSKIIKSIFDNEGVNPNGGTILLSTSGRKLPVSLSLKINKTRFSHVNLKRLQVLHSISDRALKKTVQAIRHVFG